MAFFVSMFLALSLACFFACSAEKQIHGQGAVVLKHRADRTEGKSDDGKNSTKETPTGKKIRRSLSPSDKTDSVTMMNNLRRTIGSSNMPYMVYNVTGEMDAASWTNSCNFDKAVSTSGSLYGLKYFTTGSRTIPSILRDHFKNYSREVSSVYLTSIGCDQHICNYASVGGSLYQNVQLTLCLFQGGSQYNSSAVQFKTGEACTECDSGSFWCDYGLCRGDCSASDSNCYCNSYCLNCADTDRTTCRCQCLDGWTGSRCETPSNMNTTTPSCTTTARVPRVITTIDPNRENEMKSTTENQPRNSVAFIGTSVLQFALSTVVALLLKV